MKNTIAQRFRRWILTLALQSLAVPAWSQKLNIKLLLYSLAIFHIVLKLHVKQKHIKMCVILLRDDVNLYWVFISFHIEGWLIPSILFYEGIDRPHKSRRDKTKSYHLWPRSNRSTKHVWFWDTQGIASRSGDCPGSSVSSFWPEVISVSDNAVLAMTLFVPILHDWA